MEGSRRRVVAEGARNVDTHLAGRSVATKVTGRGGYDALGKRRPDGQSFCGIGGNRVNQQFVDVGRQNEAFAIPPPEISFCIYPSW
jgi:hypothetical protein